MSWVCKGPHHDGSEEVEVPDDERCPKCDRTSEMGRRDDAE